MNVILASIATCGLAILVAGPAASQNADTAGGFTTKNVLRTRPFGLINVYNVGVDAKLVSTWAKTLSAGEKHEMVGRCSVIIRDQQNYFQETVTFCQNFAIAVAENDTAGH